MNGVPAYPIKPSPAIRADPCNNVTLAVEPWQIEHWNLPGRPTKSTDSRPKTWKGGDSVELDTIDASTLRQHVEEYILRHVDRRYLHILKAAEGSERQR